MTNKEAIEDLLRHYTGESTDMAIQSLSTEPCEDCISRQSVLDLINADWKYEGLESDVVSLPPVQLKREHGEWLGRDASGTNFYGKCSKCGQEFQVDAWYTQNMNFCSNCGADMRGEGNDK